MIPMMELNKEIRLFPLRIPAGWNITYNEFYEVFPNKKIEVKNCPNNDYWELFKQDLLFFEFPAENVCLDLGWYPEADPQGQFKVQLIRNNNWENPVRLSETSDPLRVVEVIDIWLLDVACRKI